jgi:hypothetical protein
MAEPHTPQERRVKNVLDRNRISFHDLNFYTGYLPGRRHFPEIINQPGYEWLGDFIVQRFRELRERHRNINGVSLRQELSYVVVNEIIKRDRLAVSLPPLKRRY